MQVTLPLEKMSTEEKIQTMETLWDDLCKRADSLLSPSWHKDILQAREENLKKGEDEFVDWEKAKNQLQNKLS